MLIDARCLPRDEVIETEVCIVGGGPAGLTIAHELAGQSFRVCVLESGGQEQNAAIQLLASSEENSRQDMFYPKAEFMRRRQLGGTANVWAIEYKGSPCGVRYVPLEEIDFEKRDWVPYSGWPFNKAHLDPYYSRAHKLCHLGSYSNDVRDWQDPEATPLDIGDRFQTRMFHVGPREVFTQHCLDYLQQAPNISLYYHATATQLELDETTRTIKRVYVANLEGVRFSVVARIVILAQGAIDNARLLLMSDDKQGTGIGNEYDLVGRFLMDHPVVRSGVLLPKTRNLLNKTALYDLRRVNGASVIGQISLKPEIACREGLLGMTTSIFPLHPIYGYNLRRWLFPRGKRYDSPAVDAGMSLKEQLRSGKVSSQTFTYLRQILAGIDDLVYHFGRKQSRSLFSLPYRYGYDANGWSMQQDKTSRYGLFEVVNMTEQAPDPDNRVTLSRDQDDLGCRKVKLNWRWNERERNSIRRIQNMLVEDISHSGIGQLKLELDRDDPQMLLSSAHHNIGTTRMHDNPRQGVVDGNCKVHSIANLYIAGSSVFPTSSYANPTLTIVALGIRLGDHVKQMMT